MNLMARLSTDDLVFEVVLIGQAVVTVTYGICVNGELLELLQ
jgi:hypothetical protein